MPRFPIKAPRSSKKSLLRKDELREPSPSDRDLPSAHVCEPQIRRFFGFFNRKPRWGLTFKGWLAFLSTILAGSITVGLFLPSFLATTRPVPCSYLVVEGWIPDYALEQAAAEFKRGSYQKVFCTGGPLGNGSLLSEFGTHADVAAAMMRKLGVPEDAVISVPAGARNRGRTWASALALKEAIAARNLTVDGVNVVSIGPHARRSRLLFSRALEKKIPVGIISIRSLDYNSRWWESSQGLRDILGETVGYFNELLFP